VVLQSRGYLQSENCANELEVFQQRLKAYSAAPKAGVKAPPLALPVVWEKPNLLGALPPALEKIQYDTAAFGQAYAEQGLRVLAQQRTKYPDEYTNFVDEFAERLVSAAKANLLPPPDAKPAVQAAPVQEIDSGTASFVFLVGTAEEVAKVRNDATAYADDGGKWEPYRPDVCKSIRVLASAAVNDENLWPTILPVDDDLLDRLRRAEERQAYVLLVVDPWTARLDRFRPYLEKFDELKIINTEILVTSNAGDAETAEVRDALLAELKATAARTFVMAAPRDPTTAEAFRSEVVMAIHDIRNRLIQVGKLRTVPKSEAAGALPLASGPGAT
jgi:FxsC-like protein